MKIKMSLLNTLDRSLLGESWKLAKYIELTYSQTHVCQQILIKK
jgi:hypothetical protein